MSVQRQLERASLGALWTGTKSSLNDGANAALLAFGVITVLSAAYRVNRALTGTTPNKRKPEPV